MAGLRDIENYRLVDGEKIDNLPADTTTELAGKAEISGQVFTGAISATNLSGTNTGDNAANTNSGLVHTTGAETIAGVKTFSSSPIVPAPTTDLQAATKKYVDDNAGGGAGDVTAAANLGDNLLIRGDGAVKGVQNSGISIDDSDAITGVLDLTLTGDLTIPDDGLIDGTNTDTSILVNNGTNYNPVVMSGDATMDNTGAVTVAGGTATAVVISAKVNEAAGINVGQVVFISGATGGFPQVSLADNTVFAEASVLAMATETKTDGQTISVITSGLLEGFDTSAFLEGDILYLGTSGNITKTHPSGINAVQRLGNAVKINASTGSMIVTLDPLTIINDHDGIMRHQIVNQNAGTSASAAYTVVNDALYRASLSMVGSNYSVVAGIANSMIIYNEGYNKTVNAVDGNFGFEWWTDVTDSHNLSSTSKMELAADGQLKTIQQCLEHTATEPDDHALEVFTDAAGFGDVKAIDVAYTTGAIGAGEDEGVILVNVDESLAAGGEVFALEVLTTTLGTDKVIAVKTGVGIDAISQDTGTFGDADTILNKAVDVTAALADGGAGNISIFVADNDTITVGLSTKFDEMEVLIDTGASGSGVAPTWEYSTGVGTWAAFTPTDGTNGFRNTGAMLWDSADLAGWVVGTGSEFLIRITRTRNSLSTTPIVDEIQVVLATVYSWDKNGDVIANSFTGDGSGLTGISAGHTIEDEGTPLTLRTGLNFIGGAVTATDNAGTDATDVTIDALTSDETAVTGADKVTNIMSLTQAEYDAIGTPDAATLYNITDNIAGGVIDIAGGGTGQTTASAALSALGGVGTATTDTLTNKRITERTNTISSSATPTPAGDTTDVFTVTALAAAATFAAPTGTPTNGQVLLIRIKDDATARTLAWNAIYRASTDLPLPTTTIISKTLYLQFVYNSTDSKWDLLGLLNNF